MSSNEIPEESDKFSSPIDESKFSPKFRKSRVIECNRDSFSEKQHTEHMFYMLLILNKISKARLHFFLPFP